MPHVLIAGRIHEDGLAVFARDPNYTFEMVDEVSTESYAPKLPQADALLIRTQPLPGWAIATARRLRIVSRHGVGYDAVDVPTLDARGIPLAVVGDVNSRPVAEHALALMLALAKQVTLYDAATRDGRWALRNSFSATELHGKRLFLVGFGRIGRLVAEMASAFGMRVSAYDPYRTADAIASAGAEPVADLLDGLKAANVVSLHVPKAGERPLIGASELRAMRRGALLVNTARGGLVDEDALADALEDGRIGGAGLDVFVDEPPRPSSRLLACRQAILSPHSAGLTEECAARMGEVAARNIVDFFDGRLDSRLVVNQPTGDVRAAEARRPIDDKQGLSA